MSLVYWLSKFSHEAMLIELFLIACISASYFLYLLVQKRRYGVAKKNIPDNVVRAYLVEMISQAEGFKNQLFGENFQIPQGHHSSPTIAASPQIMVQAGSGVDAGELAAIKAALTGAINKQEELQRSVAALAKDKAALEARLAAGGAPAAAGGGDPKALADASDKIAKLESKLAEYEVIEDDLANLKKYQQENKQLRTQIDAFQKGGATPAPTLAIVPPPAAVAAPVAEEASPPPAAPAASAVADAEETAAASKAAESFEGLVDKVEESLSATPASGATAADPLAAAQAKTKAAPPAAADEPNLSEPAAAPPKEKSDADLLNEFERMLSS